jgi:hypothetical protein
MSDDRPRLLHQRSELGYTSSSSEALRAEPEAVPEDYQERLSVEAERRRQAKRREAWERARSTILGGVDSFSGEAENDRALANQLRVIPRAVARIDEAVGL